MSLRASPSFKCVSSPIKSTSLPSQAYVLSIASLPSHYAVSASSPDNAIWLFDKSRLDIVRMLAGHDSSITGLRSASTFAGSSSPVLLSCGKDGSVKVWDARSPETVTALTAGSAPALLSCDISTDGRIIAAGTELKGDDALVLYWDPRSPAAPLRTHSSTHSDDITAVHFSHSSSGSRVLLSASSDGLLCTSNAEEEDEDEACLHVGNWGCSIAQAGWVYGRSGSPGIWASSDMETFSVWSGELDRVQDVDMRQPSVHRQDFTWVTDYLIGCHNIAFIPMGMDNNLGVFVGSNEGDIAIISRPTYLDLESPWIMSNLWTNGHAGVVRSVLWDEQNNILLTGGEDSKLNAWTGPVLPAAPTSISTKRHREDAMDVDGDSVQNRKRRHS
ncbi:WD40 repeat-like protein [Laetiporus sulphureus 93-53]|uniref:WD40 repeat-like protein n=1 Tax=Laetiporus sulphureus 93-53 TaxID=1314785 RepID=A0A165ICL8_9APHY|nr:WD40 repeat-like protein [Laetiporus sulphureus 93-53]KZT12893.1 WD40 repeat-like protein [Laetiporus sulphureus 93-53]